MSQEAVKTHSAFKRKAAASFPPLCSLPQIPITSLVLALLFLFQCKLIYWKANPLKKKRKKPLPARLVPGQCSHVEAKWVCRYVKKFNKFTTGFLKSLDFPVSHARVYENLPPCPSQTLSPVCAVRFLSSRKDRYNFAWAATEVVFIVYWFEFGFFDLLF